MVVAAGLWAMRKGRWEGSGGGTWAVGGGEVAMDERAAVLPLPGGGMGGCGGDFFISLSLSCGIRGVGLTTRRW